MNVNRHNYEEFFLLYVDNELSATDRNMVESFVEQNPDLGKELQLLQQTVITDDEIIFADKQRLMKEDSLAALQEKLLLFADGELSITEKQAVLSLLATDNAAATEWKILQKTKLPDEAIVFEDKRSLYRTEGGRIIGIKWWRVAAAAVLLGFGLWIGISIYKNNGKSGTTKNESIARDNNNQPQQYKSPVTPTPVEPSANKNAGNETVKTPLPENNLSQAVPEKNNWVKDKTIKENNAPQKEKNNLVKEDNANKKPGNNLPKPILENLNNPGSNKTVIAIVQPKPTENNTPAKNDVAVVSKDKQVDPVKNIIDKDVTPVKNNSAKAAGYSETDGDKNDTKILYMDEDKVKRTMIGGIFRKLKRVIERKINIKTGNGIKVAGFEIAIK